ncbi:MAG: DUF1653 domain-containing protein [Lachnospiraceae bacterium]|nr:DUF1653 domain-containing protein [Lachnospiraceae bacterium]
MRELPSAGMIYKHFKGTIYRVICIARDSETMEEVVVYENRDDESKKFVRPLTMFMSTVDREKYPDVTQEYRFEEVKDGETGAADIPERGEVPEDLMAFLDAEDNETKLDVLQRIRTRLNDDIINAIALSLDTEIREGSIAERYEEIKEYLLTMIRYEGARLRK